MDDKFGGVEHKRRAQKILSFFDKNLGMSAEKTGKLSNDAQNVFKKIPKHKDMRSDRSILRKTTKLMKQKLGYDEDSEDVIGFSEAVIGNAEKAMTRAIDTKDKIILEAEVLVGNLEAIVEVLNDSFKSVSSTDMESSDGKYAREVHKRVISVLEKNIDRLKDVIGSKKTNDSLHTFLNASKRYKLMFDSDLEEKKALEKALRSIAGEAYVTGHIYEVADAFGITKSELQKIAKSRDPRSELGLAITENMGALDNKIKRIFEKFSLLEDALSNSDIRGKIAQGKGEDDEMAEENPRTGGDPNSGYRIDNEDVMAKDQIQTEEQGIILLIAFHDAMEGLMSKLSTYGDKLAEAIRNDKFNDNSLMAFRYALVSVPDFDINNFYQISGAIRNSDAEIIRVGFLSRLRALIYEVSQLKKENPKVTVLGDFHDTLKKIEELIVTYNKQFYEGFGMLSEGTIQSLIIGSAEPNEIENTVQNIGKGVENAIHKAGEYATKAKNAFEAWNRPTTGQGEKTIIRTRRGGAIDYRAKFKQLIERQRYLGKMIYNFKELREIISNTIKSKQMIEGLKFAAEKQKSMLEGYEKINAKTIAYYKDQIMNMMGTETYRVINTRAVPNNYFDKMFLNILDGLKNITAMTIVTRAAVVGKMKVFDNSAVTGPGTYADNGADTGYDVENYNLANYYIYNTKYINSNLPDTARDPDPNNIVPENWYWPYEKIEKAIKHAEEMNDKMNPAHETEKYQSQINLLETAEALDMYFRHFTDILTAKPKNMKAIFSDLETKVTINNWRTEKLTDFLTSLKDNNKLKNEPAELTKKIFDYFKYQSALKIILSLFIRIGEDIGGEKAFTKTFKTANQIYDSIVSFVAYNPDIKLAKVIDLDLHGLLKDMLNAITSKIYFALDVHKMVLNPGLYTSRGAFSISRLIMGGADPKVKPELMEVYFRVPLLIEFYIRFLFTDDFKEPHGDLTDNGLSLSFIPPNRGSFSKLWRTVASKSKDGYYTNDQVNQIISECNMLHLKYKTCDDIMREIINEVNSRIGLVSFESTKKALKLYTDNKLYDTDDGISEPGYARTDYDILSDIDGNEGNAPSSEYTTVNKILKYQDKAIRLHHNNIKLIVGKFLKKLNESYKKAKSQSKDPVSPETIDLSHHIRSKKIEFMESEESKKQAIVAALVNGYKSVDTDFIVTASYILNELVIAPINNCYYGDLFVENFNKEMLDCQTMIGSNNIYLSFRNVIISDSDRYESFEYNFKGVIYDLMQSVGIENFKEANVTKDSVLKLHKALQGETEGRQFLHFLNSAYKEIQKYQIEYVSAELNKKYPGSETFVYKLFQGNKLGKGEKKGGKIYSESMLKDLVALFKYYYEKIEANATYPKSAMETGIVEFTNKYGLGTEGINKIFDIVKNTDDIYIVLTLDKLIIDFNFKNEIYMEPYINHILNVLEDVNTPPYFGSLLDFGIKNIEKLPVGYQGFLKNIKNKKNYEDSLFNSASIPETEMDILKEVNDIFTDSSKTTQASKIAIINECIHYLAEIAWCTGKLVFQGETKIMEPKLDMNKFPTAVTLFTSIQPLIIKGNEVEIIIDAAPEKKTEKGETKESVAQGIFEIISNIMILDQSIFPRGFGDFVEGVMDKAPANWFETFMKLWYLYETEKIAPRKIPSKLQKIIKKEVNDIYKADYTTGNSADNLIKLGKFFVAIFKNALDYSKTNKDTVHINHALTVMRYYYDELLNLNAATAVSEITNFLKIIKDEVLDKMVGKSYVGAGKGDIYVNDSALVAIHSDIENFLHDNANYTSYIYYVGANTFMSLYNNISYLSSKCANNDDPNLMGINSVLEKNITELYEFMNNSKLNLRYESLIDEKDKDLEEIEMFSKISNLEVSYAFTLSISLLSKVTNITTEKINLIDLGTTAFKTPEDNTLVVLRNFAAEIKFVATNLFYFILTQLVRKIIGDIIPLLEAEKDATGTAAPRQVEITGLIVDLTTGAVATAEANEKFLDGTLFDELLQILKNNVAKITLPVLQKLVTNKKHTLIDYGTLATVGKEIDLLLDIYIYEYLQSSFAKHIIFNVASLLNVINGCSIYKWTSSTKTNRIDKSEKLNYSIISQVLFQKWSKNADTIERSYEILTNLDEDIRKKYSASDMYVILDIICHGTSYSRIIDKLESFIRNIEVKAFNEYFSFGIFPPEDPFKHINIEYKLFEATIKPYLDDTNIDNVIAKVDKGISDIEASIGTPKLTNNIIKNFRLALFQLLHLQKATALDKLINEMNTDGSVLTGVENNMNFNPGLNARYDALLKKKSFTNVRLLYNMITTNSPLGNTAIDSRNLYDLWKDFDFMKCKKEIAEKARFVAATYVYVFLTLKRGDYINLLVCVFLEILKAELADYKKKITKINNVLSITIADDAHRYKQEITTTIKKQITKNVPIKINVDRTIVNNVAALVTAMNSKVKREDRTSIITYAKNNLTKVDILLQNITYKEKQGTISNEQEQVKKEAEEIKTLFTDLSNITNTTAAIAIFDAIAKKAQVLATEQQDLLDDLGEDTGIPVGTAKREEIRMISSLDFWKIIEEHKKDPDFPKALKALLSIPFAGEGFDKTKLKITKLTIENCDPIAALYRFLDSLGESVTFSLNVTDRIAALPNIVPVINFGKFTENIRTIIAVTSEIFSCLEPIFAENPLIKFDDVRKKFDKLRKYLMENYTTDRDDKMNKNIISFFTELIKAFNADGVKNYTKYFYTNLEADFRTLVEDMLDTLCDKRFEPATRGGEYVPYYYYYKKLVDPLLLGPMNTDVKISETLYMPQNVFQALTRSIKKMFDLKPGVRKFVVDNWSDVESFMKENFKTYIPHYKVEFQNLMKKAEYYKQWCLCYNDSGNNSETRYQDIITLCSTLLRNFGEIEADIKNSDPKHKQIALDLYPGFIENYPNNLKPMSILSYIVSTEAGKDVNTYPLDRSTRKLYYAFRPILEFEKLSKTIYPGIYDLVERYKSISSPGNRTARPISEEIVTKLFECNLDMLRYLYSASSKKKYSLKETLANGNRKIYTTAGIGAAAMTNLIIDYYADQLSGVIKSLKDNISILETPDFYEKMKYIAFQAGTYIKLDNSRDDAIVQNLVDRNIVPFNLRSLYRSTALAFITIFSANFENITKLLDLKKLEQEEHLDNAGAGIPVKISAVSDKNTIFPEKVNTVNAPNAVLTDGVLECSKIIIRNLVFIRDVILDVVTYGERSTGIMPEVLAITTDRSSYKTDKRNQGVIYSENDNAEF